MVPDGDLNFIRDAEIIVDDNLNNSSKNASTANLDNEQLSEKIDENGILRTLFLSVAGENALLSESAGVVLEKLSEKIEEKLIENEKSKNPVEIIQIDDDDDLPQISLAKLSSISTSSTDLSAKKSKSVAVGLDEPIDSTISTSNSGINRKDWNQSRPYFPPYGAVETNEDEKKIVPKVSREAQVYGWEFPSPRKRRKSKRLILDKNKNEEVASTSSNCSPRVDSTTEKLQKFNSIYGGSQFSKERSRFFSYEEKTILPQRILFSPYEIPPYENRQRQREKSILKIDRSPSWSSIRNSSILEGIARSRSTSSTNNFQTCKTPTLSVSSLSTISTPECARHIRFQVRKARNWFYFVSHPHRADSLANSRRRRSNYILNNSAEEISKRKYRAAAVKQVADSVQFEWLRQNPVRARLGKSKVHGVGVFAEEDISIGRFIMEYKGEIVRNCLVERREKYYREKCVGSYMFRLDGGHTVDGTMKGGMARFVNHSCDPNCTAKVIKCEKKKKHIMLVAAKNISKGDELSYDYKMPKERDKIPCLCGSVSCRKYLN